MSEPKRKRGGRLTTALLIAVAAAIAILWRCGYGIGLGGGGDVGESEREERRAAEPQTAFQTPGADAAPAPCRLRLDSGGLSLGGEPAQIPDAVEACRAGAVLTVTGGARYGKAQELRAALAEAGIEILERTPGGPTADAGAE